MADRFWVANSGNTSDNINHWSASSGGAPGASTPTSADSVYFDASSFSIAGQTVTVDVAANTLSMDWSGATNSPTLTLFNELSIFGDATFIAAMTFTNNNNFWSMRGTGVLTTNGVQGANLAIYNGTVTLQDSLTLASGRSLNIVSGTLDTNGQSISVALLKGWVGATLTLGASVVECTEVDFAAAGPPTLTANTATIKVIGTGAFAGGGITTYNEVQLNGTAHTISGSNTFHVLRIAPSAAANITLTSGTVQTVGHYIYPENITPRAQSMRGANAAGWNLQRTIQKLSRRETYRISSGLIPNYE